MIKLLPDNGDAALESPLGKQHIEENSFVLALGEPSPARSFRAQDLNYNKVLGEGSRRQSIQIGLSI